MKKIVIVLLIALVFTGSVFAEDFSTTLDIGHSFALLKDVKGFEGGLLLESKTIYYFDSGFGIGSLLSVEAPIYNYNNGKAIESKNPIGFGFGLFASYKLNMTSNLSLAANAGIEVTAGKNKLMTGVKQTYIDVRAIADLSCSYSFGKMSAFRLGVKGQAPFWGSMTIKKGNQTATSNTSIDFGSYFIVTPYVGYCISY